VLDPVDIMADARADDMQDHQRRDHQPEHNLQNVPPRQTAIGAVADKLPEDKADMQRQAAKQQNRAEITPPDGEENGAPRLHRVDGNQTQRMIEQMAGEKGEKSDPACEAEALRPKGHPDVLQNLPTALRHIPPFALR